MTIDARQHHPAAGRTRRSGRATLPRPQPGHLRLVTPPVGGPGPPGPPGPDTTTRSPRRLGADEWSPEQIRSELELFSRSAWGACLSEAALAGLAGVLLSTSAPSGFNGYSGIVLLNRVLDPQSVALHEGVSPEVLRAVPTGLRAWVRFNRRVSSSADAILTLALLEHVDQLEPPWQAAVNRVVPGG
jgi:hypothetical protein